VSSSRGCGPPGLALFFRGEGIEELPASPPVIGVSLSLHMRGSGEHPTQARA
jgi:hypothetical protein